MNVWESAESLRGAIHSIGSLLYIMFPAFLATPHMAEGPGKTQRSKTSSPTPRLCKLATRKMFYCKICLSEYPHKKGQKLDKCSCIFCKECLGKYVSYLINSGQVLKLPCPDALCPRSGNMTKNEISLLVDSDMFEKYQRLLKQKEVAVDKTKTFCPMAGCEGICSGLPDLAQPTVCQECGYTFCFACKEHWHAAMTCDEYKKVISDSQSGTRFVDILRENGESGDIKECPLCQVLIMREAGCAQMMCGHCKHIFCWHCLKSLDTDIMLRHYDKGPCRNKLGHSRASLFLHRTQVVAGFAFFGLMVLVASPFLLLVSPCLLLSKCLFRNN
ncbi:hypothetical protein pdam_00012736 [Pocillopora damicornis]|uniref:RBR-type E3 ubiquitin transferase n=1 Tax=Pocillopora damicornis TaxID=46731 RepID=A0A3M6TTH0_POCDA|nr:hypothetical protein pdam_00012736 [Pocillopora damicornis]